MIFLLLQYYNILLSRNLHLVFLLQQNTKLAEIGDIDHFWSVLIMLSGQLEDGENHAFYVNTSTVAQT